MISLRNFLLATLTDPKGAPDGKLVTAFVLTAFLIGLISYGAYKSNYPPEGVVLGIEGLIAACLGLSHREYNTTFQQPETKPEP